MSFGKGSASGKEFERELVPAGMHVARCYSVVDIGTQVSMYNGEEKRQRKVVLTFELPKIRKVFDEEKGEQPKVISRKYTASNHEKSHLSAHLISWFSDKKPDGDLYAWLENDVAGAPCMMNVGHEKFTNNQGKEIEYAKIQSINPVPEGMGAPDQENESVVFDLDNFDQKVFDKLPEWIQKQIQESPEYKLAKGEKTETPGFEGDVKKEDLPF